MEMFAALGPLIDRLAAELSAASILLLAGSVGLYLSNRQKDRRINTLVDAMMEMTAAQIEMAESTRNTIDANTRSIRAIGVYIKRKLAGEQHATEEDT